MNHLTEYNGPSTTENQTREKVQGQQETGQQYLQFETCENSGRVEKKRDRIVYIENSSNRCEPFVIQEVATVVELLEGVCKRFPEICLENLGMKVCDSRSGATYRKILTDILPYEKDVLYIHLYLKKHLSV
jgi:hypothetical protein